MSSPELLTGLPPVIRRDARVLILGSMPGRRSLAEARYYAHPRNAFWRIMCELVGVAEPASYRERLTALRQAGIGLWDVVHRCYRRGSLDSAIEIEALELNDFSALFARYCGIRAVFFNGGAAERLFLREVLPALPLPQRGLPLQRLPSTSPANASWSVQRKTTAWRAALRPWVEPRAILK